MQREDDEFDLALDDDAAPAEPTRRRRRRGRWSGALPWVGLACTSILVGTLTDSPIPLIIDDGEGIQVNLVAFDLTEPPDVAWSVEAISPYVAAITEDRLVLVEGDGSAGGIGLDLASGAQVWLSEENISACPTPTQGTLTCVRDPGTRAAEIRTTDLSTGATTSQAWPSAVAALSLADGGLVVVEESAAGVGEDVVRVDADRAPIWRVEGVDVVDAGGGSPVWIELAGEVVSIGWGMLQLDLETGEQTSQVYAYTLEDGTRVEFDPDGTTRLVLTDGTEVTVDSGEVFPQSTDDLLGPVQLLAENDGGIAARVRGDDEVIWRLDGTQCWPSLRASGVLVFSCWDEATGVSTLRALDELTGSDLWRRDAQNTVLVMSASTLVVVDDGVTGLDIATGAVRWSIPLPLSGSPRDVYGTQTTLTDGIVVTGTGGVARLVWSSGG